MPKPKETKAQYEARTLARKLKEAEKMQSMINGQSSAQAALSKICPDGDNYERPQFPPVVMEKLNEVVKIFDDLTTSDMQGMIGAIALTYPTCDEQEMLEYVYNAIDAKEASA